MDFLYCFIWKSDKGFVIFLYLFSVQIMYARAKLLFLRAVFKASFRKKKGKRKYNDRFLSVRTFLDFVCCCKFKILIQIFQSNAPHVSTVRKISPSSDQGGLSGREKMAAKARMKSTLLRLSNYIFLIFSCVFLIVFLIVCPFLLFSIYFNYLRCYVAY